MIRNFTLSAICALGLVLPAAANAAVENIIENFDFSFEGPFGSYDEMQLQRGLQVYSEVCAACHGLKFLSFRNLADEGGPGWTNDDVLAYIDYFGFEVWDPNLFDGEGDFRPATPADKFPAVTGAGAPDLSLMAKARVGFSGPYGSGLAQLFKGMGGAEYIASILAGYEDPPDCAPEDMDGYYNVAFAAGGYPDECKYEDGTPKYPGSWIGMAPPIYDGVVEYADGHSNTEEDVAMDVAAFLMWTAEPKLNARKEAGLTAVIFLTVLSVLLYFTNKRIWAPHKEEAKRRAKVD